MSQRAGRFNCRRLAANLGLLPCAAAFCLSFAGDALAFAGRVPAAGRPAAARPFAPNFARNAGPAALSIAGGAQRSLHRGAEPQRPLAQAVRRGSAAIPAGGLVLAKDI
jgi:hypothetical protein